MKQNTMQCPVNLKPVNQTKVRIIASFVFVWAAAYCVYPHWSLATFLMIDFFLRAFGFGRFSPLGIVSDGIIRLCALPFRPVDSAAKEFAALICFVISDLVFIVSALNLYTAGICVCTLLVCFSFLEAAFGFCAGCHIYTFSKRYIAKAGSFTQLHSEPS
jgi:hypothetical protein